MGKRSKRLYLIVFFSAIVIGAAIAIFAIFFMSKYKTITFENAEIEAIKLKQGSVVENLPTVNQEGYIFEGWYYSSDFNEESKVKEGEDILTEDIKLYPKLKKGVYTITFNINGAVGNAPETVSLEYQTPIVIPDKKNGDIIYFNKIDDAYGELNLKYWSTNADGTGDKYLPGETFSIPGHNLTLYAYWHRKETKIMFFPNGGEYIREFVWFTGEKVPENERKIYVSKTGYWFENWYFNEECLGDPINFDTYLLQEGTLNLYAKWNPNEYVANFYLTYEDYKQAQISSGVTPYETQTIYYDGFVSAPARPKRDGVYFLRWCVGIDSVKSPYNFDKKVTGNVSMFAEWTTEVLVEDETPADCFEYTQNGNEIMITGLSEKGKDLTSIVIPHQIELKNVTIVNGIQSNDRLTNVVLPYTLTALGDNAFITCPNITKFDFSGPNDAYKVVDGVIFKKDGSILYRYPANKEGTSYTVPTETILINPGAFDSCRNLTTVTINAETILSNAFSGVNSITSLVFGPKVNKLHENAIKDLSNLNYIELENNENFAVENGILYKVNNNNGTKTLASLIKCFNKTENLHLVLPNEITEIESFAFNGCTNIVSLEIGENVNRYGDYCLYSMTSLTTLTFKNANATGLTVSETLILNKGALTAIYAYENSYLWNVLNRFEFTREILVAL